MGQSQRAARLFGAAEALREPRKHALEPAVVVYQSQALERLAAQLDQATIAALWAEGRAMSLDEAVAYALEGLTERG